MWRWLNVYGYACVTLTAKFFSRTSFSITSITTFISWSVWYTTVTSELYRIHAFRILFSFSTTPTNQTKSSIRKTSYRNRETCVSSKTGWKGTTKINTSLSSLSTNQDKELSLKLNKLSFFGDIFTKPFTELRTI